VECPREHGLAAAGADGRSKDNLVVLSAFPRAQREAETAYHLE
jgi:hypothetical protein